MPAADLSSRTGARAGSTRRPVPTGSQAGLGARLIAAHAALDAYPALVQSRDRLLSLAAAGGAATADLVSVVEGDIALIIAVLRRANRVDGPSGRIGRPRRGKVADVPRAIAALGPEALAALAREVPTFDFFSRSSAWGPLPERMRLHALATRRAAERIAAELRYEDRDRLAVSCMLHDIGKPVLTLAFPGYPSAVLRGAATPHRRAAQERREFGVDHAALGGALARRWGLPTPIAVAIEHHHDADACGEAAIVRLADLLARYEQGVAVSAGEMVQSAGAAGLDVQRLRGLMCQFPGAAPPRPRSNQPCPLTSREVNLLQRLAEGSVYKQIAHELALSASTVRTHLHNVYCKLGVANRAQAVLLASERGWI